MSSALDAAYRKARPGIVLWVEDPLTRAYLDIIWDHDPRITMLDAGGWPNVAAVVTDARRRGITHVHGFRDRDFGQGNRHSWWLKTLETFVCDVHETENFLLDEIALAACEANTSGLTEADILSRMRNCAASMVWWMACRQVITELRGSVIGGFIKHPELSTITDQPSALSWITSDPWTVQTAPNIGTLITHSQLQSRLMHCEQQARLSLQSGRWKTDFSGKEILNSVITAIWTQGRTPGSSGIVDFAKYVARQQFRSGRISPELAELRKVLRSRS